MATRTHTISLSNPKYNRRIFASVLSVFIAMLLHSTTAFSQTVAIPVGTQSQNTEVEIPTLGMSMEFVRSAFGQATSEQGPVGSPPITIWHYDNYRVYFEHSIVIHTVMIHSGS